MVLNKCVDHLILFHPIYRPRHASHVLSKQMANLTKDKSYFVRFSARSIVLRCKSEKLGLRGILKRLNPSCARRHFPDDKFYKTLSLPTGAPVICKFEQSSFFLMQIPVFTRLCLMELPVLIIWTKQFRIYGLLDGKCQSH